MKFFVTDSESDLKKLARKAHGSKIFFRILTEGDGADWPLSKKFGSHPDLIYQLILKAKKLGLYPYGLSFHVGSQQRDIGQWDNAISKCKYLFETVAEKGIHLRMINLGGFLQNIRHRLMTLKPMSRKSAAFYMRTLANNYLKSLSNQGALWLPTPV